MTKEEKLSRREKIIEIIKNEVITTQDELSEKLINAGYKITQATVSRDIQKLNLTKAKVNGNLRYVVIEEVDENKERFVNILKGSIENIVLAQNLVIIKTHTGMANATCVAIDDMGFVENVGTIAGDDTIFVATKSNEDALLLYNKMKIVIQWEK